MTDKERKVIVVTGAGQGIGRAICLHFAARDFNVAVVDKNQETANETAIWENWRASTHMPSLAI